MRKEGKAGLNFYKAEILLLQQDKEIQENGKISQRKTKVPFLLPSEGRQKMQLLRGAKAEHRVL